MSGRVAINIRCFLASLREDIYWKINACFSPVLFQFPFQSRMYSDWYRQALNPVSSHVISCENVSLVVWMSTLCSCEGLLNLLVCSCSWHKFSSVRMFQMDVLSQSVLKSLGLARFFKASFVFSLLPHNLLWDTMYQKTITSCFCETFTYSNRISLRFFFFFNLSSSGRKN